MFTKSSIVKFLLVACLFLLVWQPSPAFAEGSRELNFGGTNRIYLEFSDMISAGIIRRAPIRVFVQAGETVNLGSSVRVNSVPGQAGRDIVYRSPFGGQNGSCDVNNPAGFGLIDTVARENAGPRASAGGNPTGYIPCTFVATETGIYEVDFLRHGTSTASPLARLVTDNSALLDASQGRAVAAWDITIRNGANTLGTERSGRVFSRFLPLSLGSFPAIANFRLFVQTQDGYRYRLSFPSIRPFDFVIFANNRGLIDTNGMTLYRSAVAPDNALVFNGGIVVQRPDVPDTPTQFTHFLFFNPPASETLTALGIPLTATPPPIPGSLQFTGTIAGNQTAVGAGGTFTFTSPVAGSYELIIDTNNDGIFNPLVDRLLQSVVVPGNNSVVWDGRDAQGNNLPPLSNNAPYTAQVRIRVGEYHFVLLDVENNEGGVTTDLENAPVAFPPDLDTNNQPINRFTLYYDNRNYTSANGTPIVFRTLGAPSPLAAVRGINSQTPVLSFTSDWGNFKGIDFWAYLPGATTSAPVVILNNVPNVLMVKRLTRINNTDITTFPDDPNDQNDNNPRWPANYLRGEFNQTLVPNDLLEYTIYYINAGLAPANGFRICDRLDPNLVFAANSFNANTPADGGIPSDKGIALAVGSPTPTAFLTNINDPPDRGEFVSAPTVPPNCGITTNPNGTVVVNVTRPTDLPQIPNATAQGTPPESYGFVRFRARVR